MHLGARRRARERAPDMTALLAPDPAVPQRDALLDAGRMAALFAARLDDTGVDRCERMNAKYRVGESLRVVYRLEAGGRCETVAGRTFAGRSETVFRRAAAAARPPAGGLPAGLHPPQLETRVLALPKERPPGRLPL